MWATIAEALAVEVMGWQIIRIKPEGYRYYIGPNVPTQNLVGSWRPDIEDREIWGVLQRMASKGLHPRLVFGLGGHVYFIDEKTAKAHGYTKVYRNQMLKAVCLSALRAARGKS